MLERARSCRPGPFPFFAYPGLAMLLGSGTTVLNLIILASAVVPLGIVGVLCWIFWRARNDP